MRNKKVLVVEDDADVRLGYRVLLGANNYDTFFAADGLAAISQARKYEPALIILDLGLPAGDGFWVLSRLTTNMDGNLANIPVVMVSGRDVSGILGNRERALSAGAQAYLQKPWENAELLATIDGLIGDTRTV